MAVRGSIAAAEPRPEAIVYCAASAGLNALTVAYARAYGPRVRVNAIMAGPFLTDVARAWDMPAFEAKEATWLALGRGGIPYKIVGASSVRLSTLPAKRRASRRAPCYVWTGGAS